MDDLLVKVDKCKVPMDFVALKMKEASLRHKEHMILLGRLFMATTKTMINVHSKRSTMIVLGEIVQLKAFDSLQYSFSTSYNECYYVDHLYFHVSNLSFQGKARFDLEVPHSKD